MSAVDALNAAIDNLTGSTDSRVQALIRRVAGRERVVPRAVLAEFEPQVLLLAWLLAAAGAGERANSDRNKRSQWNQQWFKATAWADTVAQASGAAELARPVGPLIFALASYFDTVTDTSPESGQPAFGAAYKALMIDAPLGYLVDNAFEAQFLKHVGDIVVRGGEHLQYSDVPLPMPKGSTKSTEWKKQWCRYVNAEFRAWIRAMFMVEVEVLRAVNVNGVRGSTQGCGKGFADLAAWQNALPRRRAAARDRALFS